MKVIMFHSAKGGTGKTTLSTTMAGYLAYQGAKVLLVDFDPQGNAAVAMGIEPSPGVFKVLADGEDIFDHMYKVPSDVYVPKGQVAKGELYFLPGDNRTHAVPVIEPDVAALEDVLEDVAEVVDYVMVDTNPSPGALITYVYKAADYVVIPSEMERFSIYGILSTIKAMKSWDTQLLGVVPTKYRASTKLHQHNLTTLIGEGVNRGWPVWTPLQQRIIWAETAQLGKLVYTESGTTGKTLADVNRLARRLVQEIERVESV